MHMANGQLAVPLQPLVFQTNKPVPGPMGPPGPPGGELTEVEIFEMIREQLEMYTPNIPQQPYSSEEWVFEVERDELGFIKTIKARK